MNYLRITGTVNGFEVAKIQSVETRGSSFFGREEMKKIEDRRASNATCLAQLHRSEQFPGSETHDIDIRDNANIENSGRIVGGNPITGATTRDRIESLR